MVSHSELGEIQLESLSQQKKSCSAFIYFIYCCCVKAFVQTRILLLEKKKKNRKNRKELQQTYHYMLFSLQRYHLNFFLFIFPLSYFRGNAFTTTFQTLKEYCGRRIAFGFISGFSAWVNYLMRCVFLGSLPNLSGLLQFYLSLGITTSF